MPDKRDRGWSRAWSTLRTKASGSLSGKWTQNGIIVGVVILALTLILTYVIAPFQEVRSERAKEQDNNQVDAVSPPILVEQVRRSEGPLRSTAFRDPITPEDADNLSRTSLPSTGDDEIGEVHYSYGRNPVPRVYDRFAFTLVGNHNKPVQVTDMKVRVTYRSAPLNGAILLREPEGAGDNEGIGFDLDDTQQTAARYILPNTNQPEDSGELYLDKRSVTLAKDERVTFQMSVFTRTCSCEFVIDVTTNDGAMTTVTRDGKPFKVSAYALNYQTAYAYDISGDRPKAYACQWPRSCFVNFGQ